MTSSRLVDLLVVVGPSGTGKTTLIKRLMQEFPKRFGYSISHTTRQMRAGETDGTSYHFTSLDRFAQLEKDGAFLESATVHGTRYGTSEQSVRDVLRFDQVVSMDLDIKGAQRLRMHPSLRSLIIFVSPPSFEVLEKRLRDRATESEDKLQTRLVNAKKELAWRESNSAFFDACLVNDELEQCYAEFRHEVLTRSGFLDEASATVHSR